MLASYNFKVHYPIRHKTIQRILESSWFVFFNEKVWYPGHQICYEQSSQWKLSIPNATQYHGWS